jgi:DNA-binding MarR family transcriptional regulator
VPSLSRNHFRALTVLARSEEGTTEALMLAHGFPIRLISELVDAGLATTERRQEGKRNVVRLRITNAGWRVLQT